MQSSDFRKKFRYRNKFVLKTGLFRSMETGIYKSAFGNGHTILRMLFADNIHNEGFCGQYRTKRDFVDALDIA